MITYEISVLMDRENKEKGPSIKRHDSGVNLAVRLMKCNQVSRYRETFEPYSIPKGVTAVIRVKKPDKTKAVVDVNPLCGTNKVLCRLPPEALTVPGTCSAEIALYSANNDRLTSATFYFDVSEECVCDDDPKSENYVDAYGEIKKGTAEALRRIGDLKKLETQEKENLVKAINEILETGGVTKEQIASAVEGYLTENPIETLPHVTNEDNGKIAKVVGGKWQAVELPVYDGAYTVIPSTEDERVLETAQKYMDADIKVKKVPYAEVTNTSGGITVFIGELED